MTSLQEAICPLCEHSLICTGKNVLFIFLAKCSKCGGIEVRALSDRGITVCKLLTPEQVGALCADKDFLVSMHSFLGESSSVCEVCYTPPPFALRFLTPKTLHTWED